MATHATLSREIALAHGQQLVGEIRALLAKAKAERSGSIDLGGEGSGENDGHPFRGNQWTTGGGISGSEAGGAKADLTTARRVFEEASASINGELDSTYSRDILKARATQRIAVKQRIVADTVPGLMASTDLNEEDATTLMTKVVDQWAASSGDGLPMSVTVQRAAVEEFGIADAATAHLAAKPWSPYPDAHIKAALRAQYDNTQKFFKDRGITHLTLARGTTEGGRVMDEGEPLEVHLQPLSSWTTSLTTAREFTVFNDRSKMLVTRVPVERVFSTCVTGNGCLTEAEVVVLGGPIKTTAYGMSQYAGDEDLLKVTKALR